MDEYTAGESDQSPCGENVSQSHSRTRRRSQCDSTASRTASEGRVTRDNDYSVPDPTSRVWMAYYHDRSRVALFDTEIDALRHAVDNGMQVIELRLPCEDVFKEAVRRP